MKKYRTNQTPVVCPIRSALSLDRDLRHQKYSGVPKAYEAAINGAGHFSRTHPGCTRAEAVVALVGAPICGGPEEAYLRWKQLNMGVSEAEAKRVAEMESAAAEAKSGSGGGGGHGGGGGKSGKEEEEEEEDDDGSFSFRKRREVVSDDGGDGGGSRGEEGGAGQPVDPAVAAADAAARAELVTLPASQQVKAVTLQTQSEQLGIGKTLADCLRSLKLYRWDEQAALNSFFD